MNLARLSIAVLVVGVLLAAYSFLRKESPIETHRHTRQVILHYTFSRSDHPIIVLGDSITEASTLPRSVCDRALVNAGLDGASTVSDLGNWLNDVLDGKRATAILVALGTNDALQGRDQKEVEANYASLLAKLKGSNDHLAVLAIPSIDVRGSMTPAYQAEPMERIDAFNAALPAVSAKCGATFVSQPPMSAPHTIDCVHLDAAGYA